MATEIERREMITEAYHLTLDTDHIMDIIQAAKVTGLSFELLPRSTPEEIEMTVIAMRNNFVQRVHLDNAPPNSPDMWEAAARTHQKAGGRIIRLSGSDLSAQSANQESFYAALRRERAYTHAAQEFTQSADNKSTAV